MRIVDIPSIEAGQAKFDIVTHSSKALALFNQVPDLPAVPICKPDCRVAIVSRDRTVLVSRKIAMLSNVMEGGNAYQGDARHISDLVIEAA